MLALNMATVSINRILSTQDRIVLDQEYTSIMNNLNLGNIRPDSDIMDLYRKILDTISQKRLRAEEAEFLQARYDEEMKDRLSEAISAVADSGAELVINAGTSLLTGNVYGFLGGLASGVRSGYFIYQDNSSEIRDNIKQDMWRLKAEEISGMNEMQKQLLTSSWNLLNQYKLPDSVRLVETAIKDFYQALESTNASQRLRMLRALENDFRAYPPYWFYRAKAARESGSLEEGNKCLDEFDRAWRPVLRQDPFMLEVCKYRIHDLLVSDKPVVEIRAEIVKYLNIASAHTPRSDWADNLFIGTVYFALGEREKAIACVRINDDFGHEKQISPVVIHRMESGTLNFTELAEEVGYTLSDDAIIPFELLAKFSGETGNLARSRRGFMSLYSSEFSTVFPVHTFKGIIDEAVTEYVNSLDWWERNFEIDPDKVQPRVLAKFKPMYETFLWRFEEQYYSTLGTDLRKKGAKGFIALSRAILKQQSPTYGEEESESGGLWYWLFLPFRIVGWIFYGIFVLIASIVSFFAMIINFFGESPDVTVSRILLERNQAIYTTELPASYWSEIEPYIKEAMQETHN